MKHANIKRTLTQRAFFHRCEPEAAVPKYPTTLQLIVAMAHADHLGVALAKLSDRCPTQLEPSCVGHIACDDPATEDDLTLSALWTDVPPNRPGYGG